MILPHHHQNHQQHQQGGPARVPLHPGKISGLAGAVSSASQYPANNWTPACVCTCMCVWGGKARYILSLRAGSVVRAGCWIDITIPNFRPCGAGERRYDGSRLYSAAAQWQYFNYDLYRMDKRMVGGCIIDCMVGGWRLC